MRRASGSPASAAANSAWAGCSAPVGHWRAIAEPGGDRLEAAALPARADEAGRVDRDVSDLARDAAGAPPEPAVEHDPGGETGAEVEVGDRAVEPHEVVGAEGGGVDVVLDRDGNTGQGREVAPEVDVVEAEVHRVPHPAGGGVDEPGDPHADRLEGAAGRVA